MIEVKTTVSSSLLEDLDLLDSQVKASVRAGVKQTADEAYRRMMKWAEKYDWQPPRTTGNLKNGLGFLVQGGGVYNITNYNATRSHGRTFDSFPLPSAPTDPYSAIIFSLAAYSAFQEFGTVFNAAHPFFYRSVEKAWSKVDFNVLTELQRRRGS